MMEVFGLTGRSADKAKTLSGDFSSILPHLAWTAAWTAVIFASAVLVFRRNMKG